MNDRAQIMEWRRSERQRLLDARMQMSVEDRQRASARIIEHLDQRLHGTSMLVPGTVVSGYWPLRGEPDLRPWLATLHTAGHVCALPVVVEKGAPLQFRRWFPGCPMERGFWDIPVPADPEAVLPRLLLAPVVGFDRQCYRLGYGGGYFDRTLAMLRSQGHEFHVLGVGYAAAELESIRPLPHDIALHGVVTDVGASGIGFSEWLE